MIKYIIFSIMGILNVSNLISWCYLSVIISITSHRYFQKILFMEINTRNRMSKFTAFFIPLVFSPLKARFTKCQNIICYILEINKVIFNYYKNVNVFYYFKYIKVFYFSFRLKTHHLFFSLIYHTLFSLPLF